MPDGTHRPAAPGALISVVATGDPGVGDGDGCGLDEQANAIAGIASRAVRMPTILPPNGWGRESGETRSRYQLLEAVRSPGSRATQVGDPPAPPRPRHAAPPV